MIYRLKKLKRHRLWRTALWLSQNCCLVLYANCRVSCYKSTLVVCAVARTVSRFVQLSFDLHWSFGFIEDFTINAVQAFQNTKKKYLGFTHAPLKFITAPRKDKHFIGQSSQLMTASNSGMTSQVGGFQNQGVCLQAFPSFLPHPLPALLLAPFFPRSFTLLPRSLLENRTETLATQASVAWRFVTRQWRELSSGGLETKIKVDRRRNARWRLEFDLVQVIRILIHTIIPCREEKSQYLSPWGTNKNLFTDQEWMHFS